jgi:hypothetical protein
MERQERLQGTELAQQLHQRRLNRAPEMRKKMLSNPFGPTTNTVEEILTNEAKSGPISIGLA